MEHQFWENAWQAGRTGWRQSEPGPRLKAHWSSLNVPAGSTVLVPLCGDSPDMRWLMDQGYKIVGCDLSELGLRQFMAQHQFEFERKEREGFVELVAPGIRLLAGDFMQLTAKTIGPFDGFYDRAATIALPPDMRLSYVKHMASITKSDTPGLLIGINYNQDEMKGPPFSVPQSSISTLYSTDFDIEVIDSDSGSDLAGRLKDRGLTELTETVYRLTRYS